MELEEDVSSLWKAIGILIGAAIGIVIYLVVPILCFLEAKGFAEQGNLPMEIYWLALGSVPLLAYSRCSK